MEIKIKDSYGGWWYIYLKMVVRECFFCEGFFELRGIYVNDV